MTTTLPALTERAFQEQVIDLAHLYGWRVAHFRPAMTSKGWRTPVSADGAGFPDLVAVRRDRILFIELKSAKGKLAEAQTDWIVALGNAGAEVWCWRPADLDYIVTVLR